MRELVLLAVGVLGGAWGALRWRSRYEVVITRRRNDAGDDGTAVACAPEQESVHNGSEAHAPEPPSEPGPAAVAAEPALRLVDLLEGVDVLVKVLGEVQVVRRSPVGEVPLAVGRQKGTEALCYLAMRDSTVDREDVEAALFPAGANAVKTFQNAVTAARKAVGEELFPSPQGGRYALSERVATDYGLFAELTRRADELGDAEEAAELLAEALSLVEGEPFTGVGRGYGWVGPKRGGIVAEVIDAADELAEVRLEVGDWRGAEWAARQALQAFPADERMYRLLMRSAHQAGNLPGVQRAYEELCHTVADPDDGIEPNDIVHPETTALLERLTAGRSGSRATA